MVITGLGLPDCYLISPTRIRDDRGFFSELMRHDLLSEVRGVDFSVAQLNASESRSGTLRGIHARRCRDGQAKYVTCLSGSVMDVVVDMKPGSSTYGQWVLTELSADNGRCLFLAPHAGHGFLVTSQTAVVVYMTSTPYEPQYEIAVDALDPDLGILWPEGGPFLRSKRDASARTWASLRD